MFLIPLLPTAAGGVLVLYEMLFYGNWQNAFLLLNLLLAWIPFLLSLLIYMLYNSGIKAAFKRTFMLILGIIWFLFYPNAPYLLTDIIHIQTNDYVVLKNHVFIYNFKFVPWLELAQFILTILTGIIVGFLSLFLIHKIIANKSRLISWIFVIFISLMSGFGIYVGRFLRLNSWEVLNVFSTVKDFDAVKIIGFSSFFGIVWFLIYFSLYEIGKIGKIN